VRVAAWDAEERARREKTHKETRTTLFTDDSTDDD
jgi:hypothetical protein